MSGFYIAWAVLVFLSSCKTFADGSLKSGPEQVGYLLTIGYSLTLSIIAAVLL